MKWKAEDCWDAIPFSEVQHNTCDKVGDVNNGDIIGTEVKIKFQGEDHRGLKSLIKMCRIIVHFMCIKKICVWNLGFFFSKISNCKILDRRIKKTFRI